LERCGFNSSTDKLIVLGDICDGWPYVYECVELLLQLNVIFILGNHDEWLLTFLQTCQHPEYWAQGGKGTAQSYLRNAGKDESDYAIFPQKSLDGSTRPAYVFNINPDDIPPSHQKFFRNNHLYYKDEYNRLFIHAGWANPNLTLREVQQNNPREFYWDRELWTKANKNPDGRIKFAEPVIEIFKGHTSTTNYFNQEYYTASNIIIPEGEPITTPMFADILVNLDTGAGNIGKLTIMDVDTHEYWQSDSVSAIYNGYHHPRYE
jgi:serine/threonine protein phosphatase 1